MVLKPVKKNLKISDRIAVLFTVTCFTFTLIIFFITYLHLGEYLERYELDTLKSRHNDYIHIYKTMGVKALNQFIDRQSREDEELELLVSVVGSNGAEEYTYIPSFMIRTEIEEAKNFIRLSKATPLKEGLHRFILNPSQEDTQFRVNSGEFLIKHELWSLASLFELEIGEVYVSRIDSEKWLRVGRSSYDRESRLAHVRSTALQVSVPLLLLFFLLAKLFAWNVLKPLKNLVTTISEIKKGDMKNRSQLTGTKDEIDDLSEHFNELMDHNEKLVNGMRKTLDNLGHDLRTPMTHFKLSAERALKDSSDSAKLVNSLGEAIEYSDKIMKLLKSIMEVAEAESGTMSLKISEVNLKKLLNHILDMYAYVAEEKQIKFHFEFQDIPIVKGDETRLLQAFANIIDNSLKYSLPNTTVTIKSYTTENKVFITILDEGIGIKKEDVNRIWERLYRGDVSRTSPGLGIGLSVVKAVIHAHRGKVEVESESGRGTTFRVSLPIAR